MMKTLYGILLRDTLMFLFVASLFSGCKVIDVIDSWNGILEPPPPDWELATLVEAENAFFEEKYLQAMELYLKVQDESEVDGFIQEAVWGLAGTKIALAANHEELREAVLFMQNWQRTTSNVNGFRENPQLMITALNRQLDNLECVPEIRYVTTKKNSIVIKEQKEKISQLESTIEKLRHQISMLEAIDQELQEKRNPL